MVQNKNKNMVPRKIPVKEKSSHLYGRKSRFSKDCEFCQRLEKLMIIYKDKLSRGEEDSQLGEVRGRIDALLQTRGMSVKRMDYKPISEDIHRVLRIHFNGGINMPPENKLSPSFRLTAGNKENQKVFGGDYDLRQCRAWRFMYRFEEFRAQEDTIRKSLAYLRIAPENLSQLNVYDLEASLFKYRSEVTRDAKVRGDYMDLFEGAKRSFIKTFVKTHGKEFSEQLKKIGVDEKYAEALKKVMEKDGRMPPVIREDDGNLLQGPTFTVHHKMALQDAGQYEDYTKVNDFSNFAIMLDSPENDEASHDLPPLHKMAHSTDKPVYYEQETAEQADNEVKKRRIRYIERLQLPEKVCFMAGAGKEFQINYQDRDLHEYYQAREEAVREVKNKSINKQRGIGRYGKSA